MSDDITSYPSLIYTPHAKFAANLELFYMYLNCVESLKVGNCPDLSQKIIAFRGKADQGPFLELHQNSLRLVTAITNF